MVPRRECESLTIDRCPDGAGRRGVKLFTVTAGRCLFERYLLWTLRGGPFLPCPCGLCRLLGSTHRSLSRAQSATERHSLHGSPWALPRDAVGTGALDTFTGGWMSQVTRCDTSGWAKLPSITSSSAERPRVKRVRNTTPGSRDRPCYHPAVSAQLMESDRCL